MGATVGETGAVGCGVGVGVTVSALTAVVTPMRSLARLVVHTSGVGVARQSTPIRSLLVGRTILTMRRLSTCTRASPSPAATVNLTLVPSLATLKVTGTRWK